MRSFFSPQIILRVDKQRDLGNKICQTIGDASSRSVFSLSLTCKRSVSYYIKGKNMIRSYPDSVYIFITDPTYGLFSSGNILRNVTVALFRCYLVISVQSWLN
jgi:hypothetical protein